MEKIRERAPFTHVNELVRLGATLPHKYLRDEAELVTVKWPAYRFLPPWQLNVLFRNAYNATINLERPRDSTGPVSGFGGIGPKLDLLTNNSQHTQLHRARQHADRTGMPYDEYMRFCFDFASRRQRNFVPRPNQLRPVEKAADAWHSALVEYWNADRMWLHLVREPQMPQFAVENARGLPAQAAFVETMMWLADEHATSLSTFFGHVVLARRWVAEEAIMRVNPEAWEQAKASAVFEQGRGEFVPEPIRRLASEELRQGCYGMPGIDTGTAETCAHCPARMSCNQARFEVLEVLRKRHCVEDPSAETARRNGRERVARSRSKKKSAAAHAIAGEAIET